MTMRLLLLVPVLVFAGCGGQEAAEDVAAPSVYTTFYPTAWLAKRIAGDTVPVVCPVDPDADPAMWQPSRDALVSYRRASLILINGAGYEGWFKQASLPLSRVVNTTRELAGELIESIDGHGAVTHSHGAKGKHSHKGIDPHTWVDPRAFLVQGKAILAALTRRFPEHTELYRKSWAAVERDIRSLDARWQELAPALRKVDLYCSHPAYDYAARRYGFEITMLDFDGSPLSDLEVAEAGEHIAKDGASKRILLWEAKPLPENAVKLREAYGLESIEFSPCETAGEGDYLAVMRANLDRLGALAK